MRVLIDVKSLLTNFMDQIGSLPTLFNDFHFLTRPTGGGHAGHLGVRFGRKMTFCAILSIWITLNRRLNTIDRLYAQDIRTRSFNVAQTMTRAKSQKSHFFEYLVL